MSDRIIAVQGPVNLLNVLSVLRYERALGKQGPSDDYLILGGSFLEGNNDGLVEVCLKLASLWPFKGVFTTHGLEHLVHMGAIPFTGAVSLLQKPFRGRRIETVYLLRNFQLFNELVQFAFPHSRLSCYGDSYGVHGYTRGLTTCNPTGTVRPVDVLTAITPLESFDAIFDEHPLVQVPGSFLVETVKDACGQFTNELVPFGQKVKELFPEGASLLLTELEGAGEFFSAGLEAEYAGYVDNVLQFVPRGHGVVIKGHPRVAPEKLTYLERLLSERGYRSVSMGSLNRIPAELVVPFLGVGQVLSCISHASIPIGYLWPVEIVVGFGRERLVKSMSPAWRDEFVCNEYMRLLATRRAQQGDLSPIRRSEWLDKDGPEAPEVCLPPSTRDFPLAPLLGGATLSAGARAEGRSGYRKVPPPPVYYFLRYRKSVKNRLGKVFG